MAWVIQNNKLVNTDAIGVPSKPFVGDSPYIFWRIHPQVNDGYPYVGLMIGVPALASKTEEIVPLTYMQEKKKFFMMLIN